MKAVLLVGGEGTRLRPLTYDVPKPLFPIAEIPYLEQLVHSLSEFGVDEMILTSCHLSEQIKEFCARIGGSKFKLTYVVEETPLGTGGAVANVANLLDETFLVLNGDILNNFNLNALMKFHRDKKAGFTLALTPVPDPSRYGVAELTKESRIRSFVEKPPKTEAPSSSINAGVYVVEPEVLKSIPKGKKVSIEREVFPKLAESGKLFGCVLRDYWLDMGTPADYLKVHYDYLDRRLSLKSRALWDGRNWMGRDVKISPGAAIVSPVLVGNRCVIEAGARVGPGAVLGEGCRIESGASVERSVLWEGARVKSHAKVSRTILGSGSEIERNARVENDVIRGRTSISKTEPNR